ncbi:MAG: hypothetical protein ACRDKV_09005 [Solirubrobacterales bacterium]
MPDLFDRTRMATVAVLASFSLLGLALVGHLATTGGSFPLPGNSGEGQVLITTDEPSQRERAVGQSSLSPAPASTGGAPTSVSVGGTGDDGRGANRGGGQPGSPNAAGGEPRQVDVSIGSGPPAPPPATPQAPGPTAPPAAGTPGTSPSGTDGDIEEGGSPPSGSGGPSNNWGHDPSSPAPGTEAGTSGPRGSGWPWWLGGSKDSSSGKSGGWSKSSSSGKSASVSETSPTAAPTGSTSGTVGKPTYGHSHGHSNSNGQSSLGGKLKYLAPAHRR